MKQLQRLLRYDWPLHFILLITNWLPDNVVVLRIRGLLARPFFRACGGNLRLGRNLTFYNPSAVCIGRDVYVAYGTWVMAGAAVDIGDEVMFGPYCVVASSKHTQVGGSYRFGTPLQNPIRIGKGSWIGAHVTLAGGADIGTGCMVAANAVVVGRVADNTRVGGVPARLLGQADRETNL